MRRGVKGEVVSPGLRLHVTHLGELKLGLDRPAGDVSVMVLISHAL